MRLNGTPPHRRAAEYLAAELRKIPGFEVEIQEVADTHKFATLDFPPFVYRTLNVVGRLSGRSAQAILLNAHFDTALDSVGAADDAAGVATILEAARVLARSAPLQNTVIVNLNGAEEIGLLGAAGFLKHRWARDVRAYVYVEALPGGRAGLFGAGPGNPWLARVYARSVPGPSGSVVGQDLVRAGLLPHNGDFTPFHEAGLIGLDMAMTGDGWAYHTMLDRSERLEPAGLRHLGDTVLAISRALASAPIPADDRSRNPVYFSVLGVAMAAYSSTTASALALVALALAAGAIALAIRRRLLPWRSAIAAAGWVLLACVAGLLAAVGSAALVALVLGRPAGWFSAPWLAVLAFGAPAAAGTVAVHMLWRRRGLRRLEPAVQVRVALAGGLLFWSALLALATIKSIGAGYIALVWVAGGSLALLVPMLTPRAPRALTLAFTLAGMVPGMVVTLELAVLFLAYFIPITGLMGMGAVDLIIAALIAVALVAAVALPLATVQGSVGSGRVALGLCALGVVGLVLVATRFPYTADRPKRVTISHKADADRGQLQVKLFDGIARSAVVAALPPPAGPGSTWTKKDALTHTTPAPPPPMPAPRAEVEAQEAVSPAGTRRVTLRIHGTSPLIRLAVPRQSLAGWSLSTALASGRVVDGRYVAQFYALEPAGHVVTLTLRGAAPVEIELRATDGARASGPEVDALLKALPDWVTPSAYADRTTRLKI